MSYAIMPGVTGRALVPLGPWEQQFLELMVSNGIKELQCNYAKGWKGDNIDFIRRMPWLEGLSLTAKQIDGLDVLYCLKSLMFLEIAGYCRERVDFSIFSRLKYCVLEWWPGVKSVLSCGSLERAYFNSCRIKRSNKLLQLRNLERLVLSNGPLGEVEDLGRLSRLNYLGLHLLRSLNSLRGLENLEHLEYLHIERCRKITSLESLAGLPSLEVLNLSDNGTIDSLAPLAKMKTLKQLYFTGTTFIRDGDLRILETLPILNRLSFANRKHYSHRREDFWQFTAPAPPVIRYPIKDWSEEERRALSI